MVVLLANDYGDTRTRRTPGSHARLCDSSDDGAARALRTREANVTRARLLAPDGTRPRGSGDERLELREWARRQAPPLACPASPARAT